jgi:hypothetical protein
MPTNRQLKIDWLKEQNNLSVEIQKILSALAHIDPHASLLPLEKAMASRSLIKKLWDLLPDEYYSYRFNSEEEQTINGKVLLPTSDLMQPVTLHLGWDVLAFSCSLEAAWHAWNDFNRAARIDAYNCCIYPASLDWYVVRAGIQLYPMTFTGEGYELKGKEGSL